MKAIQGPLQGRLWHGKTYSHGNRSLGFQGPISVCPAMAKVQPCLQQGKTKASAQSFYFIIKLLPLEPSGLLWAQLSARPACAHMFLGEGGSSSLSPEISLSQAWEEPGT